MLSLPHPKDCPDLILEKLLDYGMPAMPSRYHHFNWALWPTLLAGLFISSIAGLIKLEQLIVSSFWASLAYYSGTARRTPLWPGELDQMYGGGYQAMMLFGIAGGGILAFNGPSLMGVIYLVLSFITATIRTYADYNRRAKDEAGP